MDLARVDYGSVRIAAINACQSRAEVRAEEFHVRVRVARTASAGLIQHERAQRKRCQKKKWIKEKNSTANDTPPAPLLETKEPVRSPYTESTVAFVFLVAAAAAANTIPSRQSQEVGASPLPFMQQDELTSISDGGCLAAAIIHPSM